MHRRRFLSMAMAAGPSALLPALWPAGARAQATPRSPRIGVLANGSPQPRLPAPIEALIDALRELGYVDGRTAHLEFRWAEGHAERLSALAADLVRAQVDVIVAAGDAPTAAARAATSTLPVVMAVSGDAVSAGFVASLSRPGGNVTGMTAITPELSAKRLEVLRDLVPGSKRIAVVMSPGDPVHRLDREETTRAAATMGITLAFASLPDPQSARSVLAPLVPPATDALVVFGGTTAVEARASILEHAARNRLPAIYDASEWVRQGGLASYGVTHVDMFRESARYVDRILKGARPADLPVSLPSRVRLALNARTATALGVTLSPSLLARADDVIR